MNRWILFPALIALVLAPVIAAAEGVSFRTARGNLYSSGGSIVITENASNDIVAAGGDVTFTGSAGNELLAAGGAIALWGKTGGDIRVAGGRVTLAGPVGGEAMLAGGKIALLPQASIGSDLIAAAGDVRIEGKVAGGARIVAGTVLIDGTINQDADIKARELVIGKNAVIKGSLRYEAPQEARIEQGAVITGQTLFTRKGLEPRRSTFLKFLWIGWLIKLLAVIAAALALYFALRTKTMEVTGVALERFGRELVIGFIVLVAVPAAILVLFMTVVGWLLALFAVFLYIALIMAASVFGALVFTRLVSGYVFKTASFAWPLLLLGVLIYEVIGLIPFFGWIFKLVFFLSALGALSHAGYARFRQKPAPAAP